MPKKQETVPSERLRARVGKERLQKQGEKRFEVEETGVEVDSQDLRLVVKLKAGRQVGRVAMIAQSNIMQPAMRMTNPAELRDLVMAAPPS